MGVDDFRRIQHRHLIYILDHPYEFKNKTVLDIGSGCGASAIASKIVGARSVIANDIDAFAVVAMDMNAEANNVFINTSADNLIGLDNIDCDILLLGDMFYDTEFTDVMFNWIKQLNDRQSTYILIGDPGRLAFSNHQLSPNLKLVSQFDLPDMCQEENNGFQTGYVWTC